jgi:DivIVA domain-containing protein
MPSMAEAPKREVRRRPSRRKSAVERVRDTKFPVVMRGYDRRTVDQYVAEVAQLVAELEATQLRENVVQRALDEVGEQTSSILQRAHETAEEIEVRSRSQAEGRLQRAEREAEITRREAEHYAEELAAETRRLWEDRLRMIEEMRQLADEVLGVADDALEHLPEPEALAAGLPAGRAPPELIPPEPGAEPTVAAEPVPIPEASPKEDQTPPTGAPAGDARPEAKKERDAAKSDADESTVELPSPPQQQQSPAQQQRRK